MKKNTVVIGSGLAGTLISNELAEKHRVTLLEAGSENVIGYPEVKYINKPFAGVKTFCTGGGGTTNLWHNGLIPIRPDDVQQDEFKKMLIAAKPYYNKAASRLFWPDNNYIEVHEQACAHSRLLGQKLGEYPDDIDCLLYPKRYSKLKPISSVHCNYNIEQIGFESKNNKITKVNYKCKNDWYSVDIDTVIISAGALGTPRLVKKILESLGRNNDNVGMGLADHPLGFIGKVMIKEHFNGIVKSMSLIDRGSYEYRTALRVKSNCGQYTGCAFLRPAMTMSNRLAIYKYKSLLGASRGVSRLKNMVSFKLFHPDILAEIVSHTMGMSIPGRIYNILFLFEQKKGNSSVSYSDKEIMVDWSISFEEIRIFREMVARLEKMLANIADEVNLNTAVDDDWLWSAAHHSGTISLGDTTSSVLDTDLKMHCSDNVYVCDGSVIQEHSYANTGLTIGALALRLADRVSRD